MNRAPAGAVDPHRGSTIGREPGKICPVMNETHPSRRTSGRRPRLGFWLALAMALASLNQAVAGRPNVVLLYADDMGFGDLGANNPDSKIPTPHLDRLAREGMRFTDAHSSSGICTPSRYALLSGRYHWRKFHDIVNSFDPPVLAPEELTLPELLLERGYRTACIGKWHLGWDWSAIKRPGAEPTVEAGGARKAFHPEAFDWSLPIPGGPLDHGFDYYFGDDVPNFPPYAWFENRHVITRPTVSLNTTQKTAEGNWEARPGPSVENWDFYAVMPKLTERAVSWIGEQSGEKPFFLYFPFTSPHAPIVPTPEFVGSSQAGGYGDFMAQTDATVGAVLAALERKGFATNTLVIFSSDNGPETYAFERVRRHGHRSMGGLRGLKRDIWEGGHRVPMVVRWPGVVPPGGVSSALVGQIDLFATIAAAVGAEPPKGQAMDSVNQLEILTGKKQSIRRTLVHNTFKDRYAVRHDNWLLIDAKSGTHSGVPKWFAEAEGLEEAGEGPLLHDLAKDPGQRRNLAGMKPDKVEELRGLLKTVREGGPLSSP